MLNAEAASEPHVLIFEAFTLDPARSALLRDGKLLPLRRQSYDVLQYLAQASGRIVSNDELVGAVWSVRPAQPQDSITQCIKDIRRAMGDDAGWMIRTVSGKGCEFKAPVRYVRPENGRMGDEVAPRQHDQGSERPSRSLQTIGSQRLPTSQRPPVG